MSDRFARHHLIPGWSQERLGASTVCIAGIGALGNEVARLLAMSGVGRLILCDPDLVQESNLSRTVLFRESDIGRSKVNAAARALAELAPGVRVETRGEPLINGIGLAELRDANLVLGCLDSRQARLQLAARCALVRARSLDGGTHPWGGEMRMFLNPDDACYACGLTPEERAEDDVPWSCVALTPDQVEGAASTASSLVGSWMASMALRVLMDLDVPAGLLRIDIPRGTTTVVTLTRDPDCPLHRSAARARLIPVSNRDSVGALRASLGPGGDVGVWDPVQYRAECRRDDYTQTGWRRPAPAVCPRCGFPLRLRTTLSLRDASDDATLASLGVAPREILFVNTEGPPEWVELADAESQR